MSCGNNTDFFGANEATGCFDTLYGARRGATNSCHFAVLNNVDTSGIRCAGIAPSHRIVARRAAAALQQAAMDRKPRIVVVEERQHRPDLTAVEQFRIDAIEPHGVAAAGEGDACPICGNPLRTSRGVEVGNIFKLGTRYTDALGATFLDKDGISKPVIMGSYGIGSGRLLQCVAEEHHDERGLALPITIAPYHVHLVLLGDAESEAAQSATKLYQALRDADVELLFDDRAESPGVKFNDADLIGLPLRITVSERSLKKGGVELKPRTSKESIIIPLDEAVSRVRAEIYMLQNEVASKIIQIPFKD